MTVAVDGAFGLGSQDHIGWEEGCFRDRVVTIEHFILGEDLVAVIVSDESQQSS